MTDLIWSFAPWLVFLLTERVTSLYGAVAAGAVAALIVLIRAIVRKRVHMLDVASPLYFAALGATLLVVHPGHLDYWARYAQAGSHIALTLLIFGSIFVGWPSSLARCHSSPPDQSAPARFSSGSSSRSAPSTAPTPTA
jgi:hypothetical protein